MKLFAVSLIALVALIVWLGFLFVRHVPPVSAEQQYAPSLKEALNAVFSPLDSSAPTPAAQIQALMERAGKDIGDGKKEPAELCQSLLKQLLVVNEEREQCKAKLQRINAAEVQVLAGNSQTAPSKQNQPTPHLKQSGKVKKIGQNLPIKQPPASKPSSSNDKSVYVAAEKQRWAQRVSSIRPQCEDALRRIVELENNQSGKND